MLRQEVECGGISKGVACRPKLFFGTRIKLKVILSATAMLAGSGDESGASHFAREMHSERDSVVNNFNVGRCLAASVRVCLETLDWRRDSKIFKCQTEK
jgi:hypothetical protein